MGITKPGPLLARFQARLQILLECLPHIWIFRVRKDIDETRIYVAKTIGIDEDNEVIRDFAVSAFDVLIKFIDSPVCAFADVWLEAFDAYSEQGHHSQRIPWTKLEEFISSEWQYGTPEVEELLAMQE